MQGRYISIIFLAALIQWSAYAFAEDYAVLYSRAEQYYQTQQYQKAIKLYTEVAENTAYSGAQFKLGWMYTQGEGTDADYGEAARWYTLAANQGDTWSQNNLYALYLNGGPGLNKNPVMAIKWLTLSAKNGNTRAKANLASHYETGEGVSKDVYQAFALANESAIEHDIFGKRLLSEYYLHGIGVKKNPEIAFSRFMELAQLTNLTRHDEFHVRLAQINVAEIYKDGLGARKSLVEAYRWYLCGALIQDEKLANYAKEQYQSLEKSLPAEDKSNIQNNSRCTFEGQLTESEILLLAGDAIRNNDLKLADKLINHIKRSTEQNNEPAELYEKACELNIWIACNKLAFEWKRNSRHSQAKSLALRIDNRTPNNIDDKLAQATLCMEVGLFNEAEKWALSVLSSEPGHDSATRLLKKIRRNAEIEMRKERDRKAKRAEILLKSTPTLGKGFPEEEQ